MALDFDDIIMLTVKLFKMYPETLDFYRKKFKYILVDEYQDTNKAQYELIYLLAGEHHNLCVVGDDDQSIYKFRGSDLRNILEFEKDYPDARVIKLEANYRSTANIISAANAVIKTTRPKSQTMTATGSEIRSRSIGLFPIMTRDVYFQDQTSCRRRRNEFCRPLPDQRPVGFLRQHHAQWHPYRLLGAGPRPEGDKDVLAYARILGNP